MGTYWYLFFIMSFCSHPLFQTIQAMAMDTHTEYKHIILSWGCRAVALSA